MMPLKQTLKYRTLTYFLVSMSISSICHSVCLLQDSAIIKRVSTMFWPLKTFVANILKPKIVRTKGHFLIYYMMPGHSLCHCTFLNLLELKGSCNFGLQQETRVAWKYRGLPTEDNRRRKVFLDLYYRWIK